jgi:hypothetical protein
VAEAVAYLNNRRVSVAWNGERLVTGRADEPLEFDGEGSLLVWDLRGILKNRPAPGLLPLNPKRETLVDSGMAWGEDVIDAIMADRGSVIVPLRSLRGWGELDEALAYAELELVSLDWAEEPVAAHTDFQGDIVELLRQLLRRNVPRVMVNSLDGSFPFIPAGLAGSVRLDVVMLTDGHPPNWTGEVFRLG